MEIWFDCLLDSLVCFERHICIIYQSMQEAVSQTCCSGKMEHLGTEFVLGLGGHGTAGQGSKRTVARAGALGSRLLCE